MRYAPVFEGSSPLSRLEDLFESYTLLHQSCMFVRITADYGIEDSVERNMDSFVGGRVYTSDQHGETNAAEIIAEALDGTADEYRIVDQDLFERACEIRHRFRSDIDFGARADGHVTQRRRYRCRHGNGRRASRSHR
jgi:hypothetical protein